MPRSSCSSLWMLTSDGGIGHAAAHREAQPVGLARAVVRVLAEDQHPRLGVRREVQGGEHLVVRRVHGVVLALARGRTPAARCQYGLANSPRSTGFQSVVIGGGRRASSSTIGPGIS